MIVISLRQRVILILLALTLLTWLISVALTTVLARQMLQQQIDWQLSHYVDMAHQSVAVITSAPELDRHDWQSSREFWHESGYTRVSGYGTQGREQATNLWFGQSHVLIGELAPRFPHPEREGFVTWRTEEAGSADWRILYRHDPALDLWLAVGVELDNASTIGAMSLLRAILPLLVILPLTIPILLWGVSRGLRPLNHLAGTIETRSPLVLDPIDTDGVPLEIKPVLLALNNLLGRLQLALDSESRFTSNAAHELQTPLAAIKAEVQRFQRQVSDDHSRHMLQRISTRVARATNTVTQLLTLARLDPEQEFQREQVDLNTLLMDAIAEEGGTAMERTLDIQVTELPGATIEGNPDWLKILARNLIANAFRHSTAGSVIEISVSEHQGCYRLRVANDCEPIGSLVRQQLTDRFFTLPGNTAGGAGLGLSIVSRIAELHDADMYLDSWRDDRGFMVSVDFSPV